MSDKKGVGSKKQQSTPSPKEQETLESAPQPPVITVVTPSFISPPPPPPPPPTQPCYVSTEPLINTKRPRYTSATGEWKLLPSHPSQKQTEKSPCPSQHVNVVVVGTTASSSDTASSPSRSPRRSVSGQETSKSEEHHQYSQQQLRKGKYVSPVWKPNEMLWLARAWRVQYQGGSDPPMDMNLITQQQQGGGGGGGSRGKTRAEKDKQVAEFLQRNGVNRDAKTAGTKWDNMLGEFRKVYEWERGGEREQIGKSYFRLSPYERKLHRLPASFDEQVFEELAQFMGSRMRTTPPQNTTICRSGTSPFLLTAIDTKSFPPPSFTDDDHPFTSSGT